MQTENASLLVFSTELPARHKECLEHYFKFDTWNIKEALCLLCDIDPRTAKIDWETKTTNDAGYDVTVSLWAYFDFKANEYVSILDDSGIPLPSSRTDSALYLHLAEAEQNLQTLKRMWDARLVWKDGSDRYAPAVFIDWAVTRRRHAVTWLDWAKDQGYFKGEAISGSETNVDSDTGDLPWKTRNLLLQIIAGLIGVRSLDIRTTKSQLRGLKGLLRDFEGVGIVVDRGKLSECLREAIQMLPFNTQEELKKADADVRSP